MSRQTPFIQHEDGERTPMPPDTKATLDTSVSRPPDTAPPPKNSERPSQSTAFDFAGPFRNELARSRIAAANNVRKQEELAAIEGEDTPELIANLLAKPMAEFSLAVSTRSDAMARPDVVSELLLHDPRVQRILNQAATSDANRIDIVLSRHRQRNPGLGRTPPLCPQRRPLGANRERLDRPHGVRRHTRRNRPRGGFAPRPRRPLPQATGGGARLHASRNRRRKLRRPDTLAEHVGNGVCLRTGAAPRRRHPALSGAAHPRTTRCLGIVPTTGRRTRRQLQVSPRASAKRCSISQRDCQIPTQSKSDSQPCHQPVPQECRLSYSPQRRRPGAIPTPTRRIQDSPVCAATIPLNHSAHPNANATPDSDALAQPPRAHDAYHITRTARRAVPTLPRHHQYPMLRAISPFPVAAVPAPSQY